MNDKPQEHAPEAQLHGEGAIPAAPTGLFQAVMAAFKGSSSLSTSLLVGIEQVQRSIELLNEKGESSLIKHASVIHHIGWPALPEEDRPKRGRRKGSGNLPDGHPDVLAVRDDLIAAHKANPWWRHGHAATYAVDAFRDLHWEIYDTDKGQKPTRKERSASVRNVGDFVKKHVG